jgi:hypothetical protein
MLINVVVAYQMAEEFGRADALLREELDRQRKKGGPESVPTLFVQAMLGKNLLRQHRYTEAETLLRECLKVREVIRPSDWGTFYTRSLLGEALLGMKKYTEAESLLLEGYEGMKQREAKIPLEGKYYLTEALERLVQLYEYTDKRDEAAKWRKRWQSWKDAQEKANP